MSAVVAISARNARIIAERDALAQGKELAPLLSQTAPGAALGVVSKKFEEAIEEYLPKLGCRAHSSLPACPHSGAPRLAVVPPTVSRIATRRRD